MAQRPNARQDGVLREERHLHGTAYVDNPDAFALKERCYRIENHSTCTVRHTCKIPDAFPAVNMQIEPKVIDYCSIVGAAYVHTARCICL